MQIRRLRITGFKSFVEPADLVIEPGLTGVVGPNGCGKSNLLEALRWTMGEASAKSLRGAGMDDVIFAGTATRPARDFAEVSILAEIAGPDGADEREIVRRIERGAGSAYRIDGRDVRAKDVGLLFADAATGAHSPALVSQGRIGAVIAAKPADRRAMLEDAAGIAGLHVRRKDAEARLRATEANLARLDAVIADQDARAAALRRQARAAERYRLLSNQIRVAEARTIFARWRDAAAAAESATADAARAEARVAAAAAAESVTTNAQHAAAAAVAAARAAALAARDHAADTGHRLAGLRTERTALDRRLADLADSRRRIAEDRLREGSLASDAADALTRLTTEIATLDAVIAAATAALPALDAAQAEAERAARDVEVALAQAMTRHASDVAEARVAAAALAAARTRADRAARDAAQIEAAHRALGDPAPLEAVRATAAEARLAGLEDAAAARHALAQADSDERAASGLRDAAETARATARAELAALDSEAAALTRATQRGGRDRLLDHVTATPGLERALAAALGDDLDTDPAAWAGAAPAPGDPARPSGTTALAADVDAPASLARRLAQVFVTDRDDGQPLAVGQRLVTRDGVLRRWDGFIAQGSGAAAAERLERRNRLHALETARPVAAATLATHDAARNAIDQRIAAHRQAAHDARAHLSAAETRIRDAQRNEDRAAAALERRAGQRADLDQRAHRVHAEQADAAADLAAADAAVAALPDGRASADAVATLHRDAEARRGAVAQARSDRAAQDRLRAETRERLAAAQADIRSWRARAGEAATRITALDRRARDVAADAEALTDRPATLDAAIATLDTQHAAARADADTLQTAERAAEAALRTADDAHHRAAEALAEAREHRAGALVRVDTQDQHRRELGRLSGERFACPAPVLPERLDFSAADVRTPADEARAQDRLTAERERIGAVNLVADQQLAALETEAIGNAAERDELGQAVHRLRGSIGTLNREGRQRLLAAFETVNGHFQRLFATLFNGGSAHLELVDSDDPLEAGLEILAQPPGKRLQSLTLLSGGEQALTAVALIFALFLTNPAPICVLDEVDAPLDDANIDRFCDLLDRMARDTATRYLVVTHNAVTMSRMHRLFGVTMIEPGVSRLVSVDLQAATILVAA
ncbi:chromosome segregation SMC family protein [Sphingomonas sp. CFBP 13706]|uniref:chromosome segregation SMC family protein n=1 Tax=Sphingomonas sp. CFBP 13706 TaxID=2775314 RepID=UPI0017859218|nr:AAA family ATPase [Sphingomonas sp. CFBP 13706]MBD8735932.1 AAA family ATPase [Sphingomonas sp. CFBP 13706]